MCHLNEPLYFYRVWTKSLSQSRLCEVRIVDVLVRMKNEVMNIDKAVDYLITVIAQKHSQYLKYPEYFKINKIIAKVLFLRKIERILGDFKMGKLSFKEAKLALRDIVDRELI